MFQTWRVLLIKISTLVGRELNPINWGEHVWENPIEDEDFSRVFLTQVLSTISRRSTHTPTLEYFLSLTKEN